MKQLFLGSSLCVALIMSGCTSTPTSPAGPIASNSPHTTANASSLPQISPSLFKQHWIASEINGFQVDPKATNKPSLQLDQATKRFSGSDGCNRIMGSYQLSSDQLNFGAVATTKMLCASADQNLTLQYKQSLEKTTQYRVSPEHLILLDSTGSTLLVFDSSIRKLNVQGLFIEQIVTI
ncbi:META domain-containing protein [Acinetobacter baylyi]|uniref:META domain-containing protein n=1 Tax=Acinetobacter baylyi TaxID=202950 RepID=UPI0031DECF0C